MANLSPSTIIAFTLLLLSALNAAIPGIGFYFALAVLFLATPINWILGIWEICKHRTTQGIIIIVSTTFLAPPLMYGINHISNLILESTAPISSEQDHPNP